MDVVILERRVESLLNDLRNYIDNKNLSENERCMIKQELDRILYECMYIKRFVP